MDFEGGTPFELGLARIGAWHLAGLNTVACNLVSLAEACIVGSVAFFIVQRMLPHSPSVGTISLLGGAAVALLSMLSAVVTGAAYYDRFASRRALLPGAAIAGSFTFAEV